MLRELRIENYLLISKLDISFSGGLNTITGETGAGKSILLGAISLLLGSKADMSVLRDKEKKCVIEAQFDVSGFSGQFMEIFESEQVEYDDALTIQRTISTNGKSKFFVNQEPVLLGFLRKLSDKLVDIHSQHQTLLVGDSEFQIDVIDRVSGNDALLREYALKYAAYTEALREQSRLQSQIEKSKRDEEYIRFQYNQLNDAKISVEEFESLTQRYDLLSNAQGISENLSVMVDELSESDPSVMTKLNNVKYSLHRIEGVIPQGREIVERLENVLLELKDLNSDAQILLDRVSNDPKELEKIGARMDTLNTLQVKHGAKSIEELVAVFVQYKLKLSEIENFDDELLVSSKRVVALLGEAQEVALQLSKRRGVGQEKLERVVVEILSNLGMPNSQLNVVIEPLTMLNTHGCDSVEFMFSANKGVECESISKVASGGEMSRLMLALKVLLSEHSQMPTLIFDEIDTGVSGRVADKMGEIINSMSQKRQIINITHLPQIAAKGDTHLFVYKEHTDTDSQTLIRKLSPQERVEEIAVMLSGDKITLSAVEQAKVLLKKQ